MMMMAADDDAGWCNDFVFVFMDERNLLSSTKVTIKGPNFMLIVTKFDFESTLEFLFVLFFKIIYFWYLNLDAPFSL